MKNLPQKTQAYALKNAISHEGKAQQGSVMAGLFQEGLKKQDIKKYIKQISEIIQKVNKLSLEEQKKEFEKIKDHTSEREIREGLPELPDVKKGVVMRIAPSPSGPLHLMHAINLSLNYLYVKKYGGTLYVRIEDTNPETIYPKAYSMIKKEALWLTDKKTKIIIQSERMELYYKYAKKLIQKKSAYVCNCPQEQFREFAKNKQNCPCRKQTEKQNLEKWKLMLNGKLENVVLRFKSNMKHKNPAMRDFPLARVNKTPHSLQKRKYNVWPLMNLSVSVDDIELKMTHIIRGKDHKDNAERQKMIYKILNKKYPWSAFTGMTNFIDMKFSTRQMRKDIEDKKVSGWDDPELSTVISLKKRGYKPIAFHKFAEHTGSLSEVDKVIKKEDFFEMLDRFNQE